MDLGYGGGGDGLGIHPEEGLVQGPPGLLFYRPPYDAEGPRGDPVLQGRERADVRRREQVGAAGGELPRLDESRPEGLGGVERTARAAPVLELVVGLPDEAGEPPTPLAQRGVARVEVEGRRAERQRPRREDARREDPGRGAAPRSRADQRAPEALARGERCPGPEQGLGTRLVRHAEQETRPPEVPAPPTPEALAGVPGLFHRTPDRPGHHLPGRGEALPQAPRGVAVGTKATPRGRPPADGTGVSSVPAASRVRHNPAPSGLEIRRGTPRSYTAATDPVKSRTRCRGTTR